MLMIFMFENLLYTVFTLEQTFSYFLTCCETDFAGLDVAKGDSLVGVLRIRLDRRNAMGKSPLLLFDSSFSGTELVSLSRLVSSICLLSCVSSSTSMICFRFLPLVGIFDIRLPCSQSSCFDIFDSVGRFFLFQFVLFRRPRDFFDELLS